MNKKYKYLIIVFLIVASFAAFGRIVANDFVNFDDDKFITENKNIQSGINAESIKWAFTASSPDFWHPLTWLSIMLDWSLFGANASGYHLVSLLWHIGSVLLLFLFLSKTTGTPWPSAFVAALFALHPLRVESVAWAAERKDVLSVFFGMATIYAYAFYAEKPKLSKYFLCLILFTISLMSKPMLVTLSFVMLLLDYWPLGRWQKVLIPQSVPVLVDRDAGRGGSKNLKVESYVDKKIATPVQSGRQLIGNLLWEKVPFFFLSSAVTIMVAWQSKEEGLLKSLQHLPFFKRVMNAIISYVSYLGKTFWPVDLAVFYPYQYAMPLWQFLGALLILLLISAVVILYIRRLPFLFVGWFWYLGTLVPVIGLVQGGAQAMADRYTYFPSIGIAIMLTWSVVYLLPKEKLRERIIIPTVIILAALTFLTWQQCGYWKNSYELFTHTLEVTRDNYTIHCNMAVLLAGQGDNKAAEFHYMEALKIKPDDIDTNINFGNLLVRQGRLEEAIEHYIAAIKSKPNFIEYYNSLGVAYVQRGNWQKAIEQFSTAVKINPGYLDAQNNFKMALLQKQIKESASTKQSADGEDISTFSGRVMAGTSLMEKGDLDGAIKHFQEALKIEPENINAHVSMGLALGYKRDFDGAISHFRAAIKINPRIPEIYNSLAVALAYIGKTDAAIVQLKKAIKINPRFAKAHNTWGVMLAKAGKIDEGIDHLRKAIAIDPEYAEAKNNLDLVLSMKK